MEAEFNTFEKQNLWSTVFQEIRVESSKYDFTNKDSKKMENKKLNRYGDVTPFDHSRVMLNRGGTNYINASLIKVEVAERAYILTQGPLPSTISHFWLMVWEQNSKAIIMLNRLMERGTVKCHQYWPDGKHNDDVDVLPLQDVSLKVEYISQEDQKHYITRSFLLTDLESGKSREVIQYHYTSWPDFGLPESPSSFLEFLFAVRSSGAFDQNKFGPPVIHCSAGIGRSGTLCLVDTCLVLMEKYGDVNKVNVRQILLEMRKYRMGLIQTPEQLRFSYMAITEGTKSFVCTASSERTDNNSDSVKIGGDEESDAELGDNESSEQSPTLPLLPPRLKRPQTSQSSSPEPNTIKSNSISENSLSTNNNLSPTELRKRNREERNKKTAENIKRIKEKQKEIDKRSRLQRHLIKYGCISVGIVLVFGAGFLISCYFNNPVLTSNPTDPSS